MTDDKYMISAMRSLAEGVDYNISNLANASALIWSQLSDINWAGFYIMDEGLLKLGPFQGKVACTRIALGRGVCGAAAAEDRTQLVRNVHEFEGHIACDSASNSEIVVPLHLNGEIYGVLDIDSPLIGRFTEEDKEGLEALAKVIEEVLIG